MHFNWFFSTKAYFKVRIKAQNNSVAIFSISILLLSTIVLNDRVVILKTQIFKSESYETQT